MVEPEKRPMVSFGAARRAKREPSSERFGAPNDVSVSPYTYTNATASASPRPGARKRAKKNSLPGFPDLETLVGGAETRPDEAARGGRNNPPDKNAAPVKKEKKVFPIPRVAEKPPPAVVSNSRRKNRPKRSPDA